jgi:hypothetical protein
LKKATPGIGIQQHRVLKKLSQAKSKFYFSSVLSATEAEYAGDQLPAAYWNCT